MKPKPKIEPMPRVDETYRGYRIAYLKDHHHAWMWAPDDDLPIKNVQSRWEGETFDDLQRKARAAIDADIDQRGSR